MNTNLNGVLRLFREFAVTICASILISGVVSITLTSMMCSRFLRSSHDKKRSWFYQVTEGFFVGMLNLYDRSLVWVLRHRFAMLMSFFVVLFATVWLFIIIPKGFVPEQDTDQLAVTTEATHGIHEPGICADPLSQA